MVFEGEEVLFGDMDNNTTDLEESDVSSETENVGAPKEKSVSSLLKEKMMKQVETSEEGDSSEKDDDLSKNEMEPIEVLDISFKEDIALEQPTVAEEVREELLEEVQEEVAGELTREEKRKISKKALLTLFKDELTVYSLSDLYTALKPIIPFETSVSSVRSFLLDLNNENKIEIVGRGKFRLASQISLFDEEVLGEEKPLDILNPIPSVEQPEEKEEPTPSPAAAEPVSSQPVAQQPQQQVVYSPPTPVVQAVQYVTVEEEKKPAENFSPLFYNDVEVEEYLEMLSIPKPLRKWVIEKRAYNRNKFAKVPQEIVDIIPGELGFLGKSSILIKALAAMKSDTPLSLKGPAGTGKTTLTETIAALLNYPLFSVNGSLESNKATLVGEPTIKHQGVISIKDGQMQKAAVYGGILYIDEINMMRPDMLSIVNGFLDHRKSFQNDVRGEMTFADKDTRFISAMNVGYAGTKAMNKATSDRNVAIQLEYMSKIELKKILSNIINASPDAEHLKIVERDVIVEKVAKFYSTVSQSAQNGLVPDLAASTRSVIQLLKLVPILDFQLSLEMILDKYTEDEAAQIKGVLLKDGLDEELGINFTN